jgi:hypothetical protein
MKERLQRDTAMEHTVKVTSVSYTVRFALNVMQLIGVTAQCFSLHAVLQYYFDSCLLHITQGRTPRSTFVQAPLNHT